MVPIFLGITKINFSSTAVLNLNCEDQLQQPPENHDCPLHQKDGKYEYKFPILTGGHIYLEDGEDEVDQLTPNPNSSSLS